MDHFVLITSGRSRQGSTVLLPPFQSQAACVCLFESRVQVAGACAHCVTVVPLIPTERQIQPEKLPVVSAKRSLGGGKRRSATTVTFNSFRNID